MLEHLPKEVREGLEAARLRAARKRSRLRLQMGDAVFPVLRNWPGGFALEAGRAPNLRGLVDLYDGSRHLSRCLIVASSEESGEIIYEFKQVTEAVDGPALDFEKPDDSPVALLARLT